VKRAGSLAGVGAVLALAAVLASVSCEARRPRLVLLILLDAARADRLSSNGYARQTTPRIDALAREGVVFRNHFSQATHTRAALPALLWSRYFVKPLFPASDQVPYSSPEELFQRLDDEAIALPRALAAAGYHTAMISSHSWLQPGTDFARAFDETHDLTETLPIDRAWEYPRAEAVVDYAIEWLAAHPDRDTFLYLHLMDTHFPHHLIDEARLFLDERIAASIPKDTFGESGAVRDVQRALTDHEKHYLDALYDGGLRYADAQVGRLLDALGVRLDDALVVVTADHGEYLMEVPGRFRHGGPWFDIVARVPLIIYCPSRLEPAASDAATEAVDVMPTVLGLLGVRLPAGKALDGRDVLPVLRGEAPARQYVVAPRSVRGEGWKAFFAGPERMLLGGTAPRIEDVKGKLYDLSADPLETVDLWQEHPDVASRLFAAYRERIAASFWRYVRATTDAPPESPFALGTIHFFSSPGVPEAVKALDDLAPSLRGGAGPWTGGWITDPEWSQLVAGRGAGPIDVTLRIPDGRYLLSAGIRGSFRMTPAGAGARTLTTGPFDPREWPWSVERAALGEIAVTGQTLSLKIEPVADASPALIRYLGFAPVTGEESLDDAEREERLKRLQTLGYVD